MVSRFAVPLTAGILAIVLAWASAPLTAQKQDQIPHGQDRPPGPALSPKEAIAKMTVPPGFSVELVAAEPDIVNPVAMTFDERGRIWITESLEYPRHSAGPGKDRVKVLESTKGDGNYDKITTFADGLNIPSGIAVGNGGVYVANAPDLLFYKKGSDGKAVGKPEVIVTGFGRADTHEVPNSLTWGPDGWLYGLNGVFNQSHIKHQGKEWHFTCALFRIHPKTKEFQLFAEGTSNPWGVAWDNDGSAFVSACVIDHLWHLVEGGYYHRQGGAYPPYTWKLGSIVKHKHQKAAYCGIHFFDSDAYPPEYREQLYMGNIHGGCINRDILTRDGATYFAKPLPDFLTANDQWFMPVAQKTGPDGCLYILDWYDKYHCYQDANRDPAGIDRTHGRLYRVRYTPSPNPLPPGGEGRVRGPGKFDLAKETDDQLIARLASPNVYFRDLAQRLLWERNHADANKKLEKLVLDESANHKTRMHALWAMIGTGKLDADFHKQILANKEPSLRAWGVRAAGNFGKVDAAIRDKVISLASDPAADVQLQVAIAARKLDGVDAVPLLVKVLSSCGDDKVIPVIVWQNIHPLLEDQSGQFLAIVRKDDLNSGNLAQLMPRVIDRIMTSKKVEPDVLVELVMVLGSQDKNLTAFSQCLGQLAAKIQSGELAGPRLDAMRPKLKAVGALVATGDPKKLAYVDGTVLAASLKDEQGIKAARGILLGREHTETNRIKSLDALIVGGDSSLLQSVNDLLGDPKNSSGFRGLVVQSLGKMTDPAVATAVLGHYPKMEKDLQPKAIELLTQRTPWSKSLMVAISDKKVSPDSLNVNQVRRMLASKDAPLIEQVKKQWGTLREERNPAREKVVAEMRAFLQKTPGDAVKGIAVFKNLCGQCHKLHGEGFDVGPDITNNGRSDFEQLLSNVFDPSLVIGAAYQATTVLTKKGQAITGLLVEDNAQRVVLKMQGGKLETIPRADIEEVAVSKLSMMPEDIEKQLKPQEIADLFAYLVLDKPPSDPTAKRIPGAPNPRK